MSASIFRKLVPGLGIHRSVAGVFSIGRTAGMDGRLEVDQVHEHHADFVWKSLQRLGVRDADLDDALQDVFVVVHRKLHTFDGSARVTTWLYGIALRVASAYRRKAHLRREEIVPEMDEKADATADRASDGDPESALLRRESRERLERVLDSMGLERRAVFVMFEIEGLTAAEIGDAIGVPVSTVNSRLFAARAEFARIVERLRLRERSGGRS